MHSSVGSEVWWFYVFDWQYRSTMFCHVVIPCLTFPFFFSCQRLLAFHCLLLTGTNMHWQKNNWLFPQAIWVKQLSKFFINIFKLYVCVYLHEFMYTTQMHLLVEARREHQPLELQLYALASYQTWDLNLGPLQEQLFIAKPSLCSILFSYVIKTFLVELQMIKGSVRNSKTWKHGLKIHIISIEVFRGHFSSLSSPFVCFTKACTTQGDKRGNGGFTCSSVA